jgi:hypothetical protein
MQLRACIASSAANYANNRTDDRLEAVLDGQVQTADVARLELLRLLRLFGSRVDGALCAR